MIIKPQPINLGSGIGCPCYIVDSANKTPQQNNVTMENLVPQTTFSNEYVTFVPIFLYPHCANPSIVQQQIQLMYPSITLSKAPYNCKKCFSNHNNKP